MFVYRAVDGHAVATQVVVSRLNGGKTYVVESGLQEGDVIITEGVAMMKDGAEI